MTPFELQEGVISAYDNFYSRSKSINHFKKAEFFYGFSNLYVRHLFRNIIKENQYFLDYLEGISS